jgi:RNA polymerase sigma-70 factor (ECF subfamily)
MAPIESRTTDAELLRRSSRKPDAFVELCERHAYGLRAWLRRQTLNEDVAADLLAETLAEAWRVRRRFRDPGSGSAQPWLFGIAKNLLGTYRRSGTVEARARARLGIAEEQRNSDPQAEVDSRLVAEAQRSALSAAAAELPVDQRQALALRVVGERGYEEIAIELGISPTTARTRVFRALRAMRASLEGGRR